MMTEQAHVPYYCLMNGSLARGRDLKCGEAAEAAALLNPRVALRISVFLSRMRRPIDFIFRAYPVRTQLNSNSSFGRSTFACALLLFPL
jgi:hypothetical protein